MCPIITMWCVASNVRNLDIFATQKSASERKQPQYACTVLATIDPLNVTKRIRKKTKDVQTVQIRPRLPSGPRPKVIQQAAKTVPFIKGNLKE